MLLTRPKELISGMADLLRQRGAEVLELPAIRTEPVKDDAPVRAALETLDRGGYDWLVFTSPSGVRIFFDDLIRWSDIRALGGVKIAAIGQGTVKALKGFGLTADFLPTVYDGDTLGAELAKVCAPGSRILIPRAAAGNPRLAEALRGVDGAQVTDLATYETVYAASRVIDQREAMESGEVDFAVFTSASTVKGFAAASPQLDYSTVKAICIGKQTCAAAEALGMRTWVSDKATLESLADKLEQAAAECRAENNN